MAQLSLTGVGCDLIRCVIPSETTAFDDLSALQAMPRAERVENERLRKIIHEL